MNTIITKPLEIESNMQVLYTGNHYISVPEIEPDSGAIQNINFVSLSNKALIELAGREFLFRPVFRKDGRALHIIKTDFVMRKHYLPEITFSLENDIRVKGRIYADLSEKGFLYSFESSCTLDITLQCDISHVNLLRFSSHPVAFGKEIKKDKWLQNLVLTIVSPGISLSMAFGADDDFCYDVENDTLNLGLVCNERNSFYIAANSDPDGASTMLIHLLRKGYEKIYSEFAAWIGRKELLFRDEYLTRILNQNLLYNYFFAVGKDMESDRYIALTSRSPRYYVSGAFWERDSFLWSLPSIKLIDPALYIMLSRDMIRMHSRNAGDHAHYIDGTVLYPGFELDEAASYFILIGDMDERFLGDEILVSLDTVFTRIEAEYDDGTGLYRTFLLPSDDPAKYPFVTIDNVLLWRGLQNYKKVLAETGETKKAQHVQRRIDGIRSGIYQYLTAEIEDKKMFVWSADENGNYRLYNDPPGNLSTMCFYGFVGQDDPLFANTIEYYYSSCYKYYFADASIKELACDHHPNTPSGLGLCASLLNPMMQKSALRWLKKANMDYGLLAESMDRDSGEAKTGVGFATGAGYLALALYHLLASREQ